MVPTWLRGLQPVSISLALDNSCLQQAIQPAESDGFRLVHGTVARPGFIARSPACADGSGQRGPRSARTASRRVRAAAIQGTLSGSGAASARSRSATVRTISA